MSLFGITFDPSNQTGGIAKWAATAVAGFLAGKFGLGADGAATISALVLGAFTLGAQIYHRWKVAKALKATAGISPTSDPEIISKTAAAA
jgi:hypothetical protein